ncbi:MAG: hypothetical protein AB1473_09275 [Thermodesulfobacteriota bacterium]
MSAYIEHQFEKGFLLDEERLRRIVDIINRRASKADPHVSAMFLVFKADSYTYETDRIEDVISEDNADWRRITRLEIRVEHEDDLDLKLAFFDKGSTARLVGQDRDRVYLLFSDLREYLKNEVNVCWTISEGMRAAASIAFMIVIVMALMGAAFWGYSWYVQPERDVKAVLSSTELREKLDFLVERSVSRDKLHLGTLIFLIGVPILLASIATDYFNRSLPFFFPANLFLFGAQKEKYERRKRMRGNIVWGVGIAFVISVIAGLAVGVITNLWK